MTEICGLKTYRISYSIVCFNDVDPEAARNHWAKELKLSRQKFGKITQIPTQGRGTYKKKSKFGVCTVQANNVKLRAWMMEQISSLQEKLLI